MRIIPLTGVFYLRSELTDARVAVREQWHTIASLEVYQTGAMVGLSLLAAALAGAFIWRQRFLRRALVAERERTILAERLALITRHANDIIILLDEDGRILEANERALSTYGYTPGELRALPRGGLRPPGTVADLPRQLELLQSPDGAVFETVHRRKDGSVFPVEASGRVVTIGGRRHFLGIFRDITQRKAHEAEIARLNRMYFVISQVNQAIVRTKNQPDLLQEICRVLVEVGHFRIAWVGWLDPLTRLLTPVAIAGDEQGYVPGIRISADPSVPEGRGLSGVAFQESRIYVCNDFFGDEVTLPWRERAARSGFQSSIALPLRCEGKTLGLLKVYAAEKDFFGVREIALLEQTAGDLSYALDVFAGEARRREAEAALRESEARNRALISAIPDLIFVNHRNGEFLAFHATSPTLLAQPPETFLHRRVEEVLPQPVADQFMKAFAAAFASHAVQEVNYALLVGGRERLFEARVVPSTEDTIISIVRDISERKRAEEALLTSLREKEALLKEVHHRVKNNLQVISSLLHLEIGRTANPAAATVLNDMKGRIRSMALLHETLYRSGNLAEVDLSIYLRQLATQLFRAQNRQPGSVRLRLELVPARLEIDQAIPCGLIVNELASNSLKHGFPGGRSGEVNITLQPAADGQQLRLQVGDTGVGLPADFALGATKSLGLLLVADLARQLRGKLEFSTPGSGAIFTVTFTPRPGAGAAQNQSSPSQSPFPDHEPSI